MSAIPNSLGDAVPLCPPSPLSVPAASFARRRERAVVKPSLTTTSPLASSPPPSLPPFLRPSPDPNLCHYMLHLINRRGGEAVTPTKTLAFLKHESQREIKRTGGKLSYNSLRGYVNAVVNLWNHQQYFPVVIEGVAVEHCTDHPRSSAVKFLLKNAECEQRMNSRGSLDHTIADGSASISQLSSHRMAQALIRKRSAIGDRTRVDVTTAMASVCRGHEVSGGPPILFSLLIFPKSFSLSLPTSPPSLSLILTASHPFSHPDSCVHTM